MPSSQLRVVLDELVALDTTSANSTATIVAHLAERLERPGVQVWDLIDPDPPSEAEQHNLLVRIGPEAPNAIVLSAHLDCVPVTGQPWTSDPFTVSEAGGRLVGRGVTDMKGFVAACLAGLADLDPTTLQRPIVLAFSHSEEIGTRGAPHLVHELRSRIQDPALCIVGEPTLMEVVQGHKGIGGYRVTVTGIDGHSSQPRGTAQAIHAAGRILNHVADLALRHEDQGPYDERFDPPYSTFAINRVEGGQAINIVPRLATMLLEGRNIPEVDLAKVFAGVQQYAEEVVLPELARHASLDEVGIAFAPFSDIVPPLLTPDGSAAEEMARSCGALDTPASYVSYATDAGHFAARDIPTIVCGPGSIEQAHKPDEWIDPAQLDAAEQFIRRVGQAAAHR